MAAYGMIWPYSYLESHIRIFAEGQFCAEINRETQTRIIASASSLIIKLQPEYAEHTWYDITGAGMFTSHNPRGDTLYGADISTHP